MARFSVQPVHMDWPNTIGGFRVPLDGILSNASQTRNAAGDVSINVAASQNPALMTFDISIPMKQINSLIAAGTGAPATAYTPLIYPPSIPTKNADGTNPILGDGLVPKGVKLKDITLAYSVVGGGGLTSASFRLDQNTFIAGANVISSLIAVAQNGINLAVTASATTCSLTVIPVTTPTFDITDNDAIFAELNVVTPAGCTFRLYEVFCHCDFNFN